MMGKLSDKKVQSLKPQQKEYTKTDGDGLQITIRPNNKKRWEFIFKSPTLNKRRKLPLGYYPTITLKTARELTNKYLNQIKQGIDPIDYKKEVIKEIEVKNKSNFELITDEWLDYESKRTTPETHKRKKAIIVNDCYPYLKDMLISDIKHQDIIRVIKARLNKTIHKSSAKSKQNDGIETTKKLYNYLNKIFKYAITNGLCSYNPINDIEQDLIIPKAKVYHHPKITDNVELEDLINKIYNYKGHYSTINALKFALHIPLRAENLANLKWEYIDFEEQSLTIPRELMKVKNHNLPDFKISLSNQVINILKTQYKFTSHSIYVFLSDKNTPINKNTPNTALKRMGYQDKQTLHGFRGILRSLADTYQEQHNCSYEVKRRFLDHHDENKVERAYNHRAEHFEQMKPFANWWSDYLEKLVGDRC